MTRKATKLPASGPHAYAFLSSWREITGLTQAAVAAYFGVSDVTIHRWETGKAPITVENFVLLAKLFHAETPGHLLFPPHAAKRAAALREANVIADRMSADDLRRWLDIGISLAHKTSDQATGEAAD
jgi:transcriptional regulator with XRE-family HTH domain